MENSATSRICTYEQQDQYQATSFHQDSSWTSSMDDLLFYDRSITSSYDHHDALVVFSSSYEHPQRHLSSSATSHGGDQPSISSHRKRRKTAGDDDLEDTATSPPHPAIISKMGGLNSKQKKKQRAMISQRNQKGKGSEEYGEVVEDRIEVGFVRSDKNCSTGLKHIGLCLVPVSMAVNYFG